MQFLTYVKVINTTIKFWALYQVTKDGKSNKIIPVSEALSLLDGVAAS